MTVKLTTETIKIISIFEKVTETHARDCIVTDSCIYFLVNNDKVGLAVGKNGQNVKKLSKSFKKNIKIFGYSNNLEEFIKNIIPNIKKLESNNSHLIVTVSKKERFAVIGRRGENIKAIREFLKRNFHINNFRVR